LVPSAAVTTWRRDIWQMWLAQTERKHFLVFPVRRGELFNYVGFVPSTEETLESWTAQGNPDRLRAEFAEWDPRIVDLLSHVEHTFWWQMNDREPISRWTNGRLTLLGDAAHPMLPHLGQGANQALEDCAALATILAHSGRAEVGTALLSYESLRKERAAYVQTSSRANGLRYDATEATADRDVEISEASGLRWSLYDYDAEAAAEALFA
jgi:salicylate hydroxylase